jgi:hypothetical protein
LFRPETDFAVYCSTPNFEETPTVAIEQGGGAESAIDRVNETIDSITNTAVVLVADRVPAGEMSVRTMTHRLYLRRLARERLQRSKP